MRELVSFMGGLLLLFSWLTQTFLSGKWQSRLAQIREARSAFLTYQSNNALF